MTTMTTMNTTLLGRAAVCVALLASPALAQHDDHGHHDDGGHGG